MPQDVCAQFLSMRHPAWDVWWSRRSSEYRARLRAPARPNAPAMARSADAHSLEIEMRQYRDLAGGLRRLLGHSPPRTRPLGAVLRE
ncbi:hypothetical protein [Streptomonospora nanhaiensis]|uniref:hypothetical protein n=1 Tax=Streptomonospora nanhaiensis TaxID=1323731 RepID=UPI001C38F548|nr:hypothetical protein [Streptomonospora nanhaiensis]MBV2366861.1 hypothetical protein [Streptomonospora nanhaiensis]